MGSSSYRTETTAFTNGSAASMESIPFNEKTAQPPARCAVTTS